MAKDNPQPVWLVTGAAGALGRELVRQILGNGKDCIALDRDARGLDQLHDQMQAEDLPVPAIMPLDLAGAVPTDFETLADKIDSEFGRLEAVIHNAATFTALRPLVHQPAEEWMSIIQTALTGPFLLTSALMPLLSKVAGARIVFISDRHCLESPANWAAYGVSQAGRHQMARILAEESGHHGPAVIECDPGPFYSRLRTAAWPSDSPEKLPSASEAARSVMERVQGE